MPEIAPKETPPGNAANAKAPSGIAVQTSGPGFEFNKFFVHRLGDSFLLITDLGRVTRLGREEFREMRQGRFSMPLFKKLEQGHIIATVQNRPAIEADYGSRYSHTCEGVSLHIINPTMRCNQSCHYCYANSRALNAKGFDMDEGTAKKVVDFIWQSPSENIVIEFQGGEPLANFPLIEFIMGYANQKKGKRVHWRIVSNLTMMDETIAGFLKKNNVFDICTSIDGPKALHDKNRPMAGGSAHDRAAYWVNALRQDYGFGQIGALCTVTRQSLPLAREIVEEYLALGFRDITPVPLRKIGLAGKNWERIGYSWQEYVAFWKEIVGCCIEMARKGRPISEQFSTMSLGRINRFEPSNHTCFSKPCGAALMQCSYLPNGDIYTCDEAKAEPIFRIGSVNQAYKAVFTSPEALNIISLSSALGLACNECAFTGFCRFCPVMAYCTQGNFVPKLALDSDCKTKKAQFEFLLEKVFSAEKNSGKKARPPDREILLKWLGENN
jgi:His-Xaa-Ser system radical SAM maturase HxsB